MQPAIELADEGFAATPRSQPQLRWHQPTSRAKNSPAAAFFCPGGQPVPVGTLVTNKPLAETFRLIAARARLLLQMHAREGLRHRARASSKARS